MEVSDQIHPSAALNSPPPKKPRTHRIRGWVGLRSGTDAAAKKITLPLPGTEPRSSNQKPTATLAPYMAIVCFVL